MSSPNIPSSNSNENSSNLETAKQKAIEALKPDTQKITANISSFQETYCSSPDQFSKNSEKALATFRGINYNISSLISKLYELGAYQQAFELVQQISNFITFLQTNTELQQGNPSSLNEEINDKWVGYWTGLYTNLERTCNKPASTTKGPAEAVHQSNAQLSNAIDGINSNLDSVLKTIN